LQYNKKYYYKVGTGKYAREFWFVTPPAHGLDTPYTFGLIGEYTCIQSYKQFGAPPVSKQGEKERSIYDSAATLEHYLQSYGQSLLFVGDLAYQDDYPDNDQNRWDTWTRFAERSFAYQPWIWTAGNHELDLLPAIVSQLLNSFLRFDDATSNWSTD
jgi:hypothetical protein